MSLRTGCAQPRRFIRSLPFGKGFAIAALVLLCAGCVNLGTGVKTLGGGSNSLSPTNGSDSDVFAVSFAFRDSTNDTATPIRVVNLQGVMGNSAASFAKQCGATGATCNCLFFRSSSDTSPATAVASGVSTQNNSLSCTIPGTIPDATIRGNATGMFVELARSDNAGVNTGLVSITTKLTIDDVLGPNLSSQNVRGIYRYSCTRTFFEGQGVAPTQITCVGGQQLGLINAAYNFYLYQSRVDNNMANKGGDEPFPSDVCKITSFLKISCSNNSPQLRFGLYNASAAPYIVGISMTPAPSGTNSASVNYGFAALPDSAGNCPMGLVKIRPFVAEPASIIKGALDNNGNAYPQPSSFINTNNSLKDTVVEPSAPDNFLVNRSPNATPCAADGTCNTSASFQGSYVAESIPYSALTPVVCAIPSSLVSGLF
jgi:hypothetical protein